MNDVTTSILEWAEEKLPPWQTTALHKICTQSSISQADIEELADLCLLQLNGEADSTAPASVQPTGSSSDGVIKLNSVSNVTGVNALKSGQTLAFADEGVTVIYGDNGTGKTGYSRIIKDLVRARGNKDAVLCDYRVASPSNKSAQISYSIDGASDQYEWNGEQNHPEVFTGVSFFDSKTAHQYVSGKNDVAYRPFGLDLLDRLCGVIDQVKLEIGKRASQLESQINFPDGFNATTKVGGLLYEDAKKKVVDWNELEPLGQLTKEEADNLQALEKIIKQTDPAELRKEQQKVSSYINRLQSVLEKLDRSIAILKSENISQVLKLKHDISVKKRALATLAQETFEGALEATGGVEWKELWLAAKKYSGMVYPNQNFPVVDDAHCVLCQQPLVDDTAKHRMISFEAFVKNDINKTLEELETRLSSQVASLNQLTLPDEAWASVKDDVDDELFTQYFEGYLVALGTYYKQVLSALKSDVELALLDFVPMPSQNLVSKIKAGRTQLEALSKSTNSNERATLLTQYNELHDRKKFGDNVESIKTYFDLCQKALTHRLAQQKITTSAISRKSVELTNDLITTQLVSTFQTEIQALGVRSVSVELTQVGSEKGSTYFQVLLSSGSSDVDLTHIASEGEHRAVAVAGFLTELSTAEHNSSIVLDDPVTSLDHGRRDAIARRLVNEGRRRQVIIFTHEITFLMQLHEISEEMDVPFSAYWLRNDQDNAGIVNEGMPWLATKVRSRLDIIRRNLADLRASSGTMDGDDYEKAVIGLYALLRQAWERAVEECLLRDTVMRFGREVKTQNVRYLRAVQESDIATVEANMGRISTFVHDRAPGETITLPTLDEVQADINTLDEWLKDLKSRQKPHEKNK